jgi:hypothetical protein
MSDPAADERPPVQPEARGGDKPDKEPGGDPKPGDGERSRTDVLNEQRRRGTVQDRIGTERDALSGFVRAGQYIGGDQHNYTFTAPGGRRSAVAPLPQRHIEETEYAFVAPDGFDELCRRARDHRIVILQDAPDTGRYAAARRLLHVLAKEDAAGREDATRREAAEGEGAGGQGAGAGTALFRVDPAVGLDELTADDLERGAGYVYREPRRPDALTDFVLDKVTRLLEDAGARLVITVDSVPADARAAGLVHQAGRVRDRREIVTALLTLWLGRRARPVLTEEGVPELLDAQLGGDGPPGQARAVAQELYKAHRDALPLARTAEQALRLRDGEQRAEWFAGLGSLSVQCMAVATAVLNGEPYETVALAAMRLKEDLETREPHRDSLRRLDAPLRPTRRRWLDAIGARTVPSTVRLRDGATAPTRVVRYLDPDAQGKVLGYFWSEFDEQRPRLLGWLRWCAEHPLETVRTRTAVALGFLAADAFDLVNTLVIEPMAADGDYRYRTVAAAALHVTVTQRPALRAPVREMLKVWADPEAPVELRASAARAWRVESVEGGVSAALDWLGRRATDDDVAVTAAVCESVTEMWEDRWDGADVPRRLLKWANDDDENRRITGLLAFLVAASQLVRRMPGDAFDWPGLLHVAAADDDRMRDIAALWRETLHDPVLQEDADEVLTEWARTADEAPVVRRTLARLARAIATDRTVARAVAYTARGWAEGDAPGSARDVLTALNGR